MSTTQLTAWSLDLEEDSQLCEKRGTDYTPAHCDSGNAVKCDNEHGSRL